jgi:quinate dehydrogenase
VRVYVRAGGDPPSGRLLQLETQLPHSAFVGRSTRPLKLCSILADMKEVIQKAIFLNSTTLEAIVPESSSNMAANNTQAKTLHLVGIGVKHSIAPPMHNMIAKSLGLPWTFHSTECDTVEGVAALARDPSTAGLVVTMPYKNTIMPLLDELDDLATTIGACNNTYRRDNKIVGTNTDWRGIKGCLLEKGEESSRPNPHRTASALIVGAGGASRAAVYALSMHLSCPVIYVLNRDDAEVAALVTDTRRISATLKIIHVKSLKEASSLDAPYYVVGTVPDFEPQTEAEKDVAAILKHFLSRNEKGVVLDMCFKPRRTRMIKLAEELGWPAVEGTHVIGYQIQEQWRLWAGDERAARLDADAAWKTLLDAAEESTAINF